MLALLTLSSALLAGCGGGFTQASTTTATPYPGERSASTATGLYAGRFRADGVFAVGGRFASLYGQLVDGQIPPGRYRVELLSDEVQGSWIRCRTLPCGPAYPTAVLAVAQLSVRHPTGVLELGADDVAVWLTNVNLTALTGGALS